MGLKKQKVASWTTNLPIICKQKIAKCEHPKGKDKENVSECTHCKEVDGYS
jgi:hypothetical protein